MMMVTRVQDATMTMRHQEIATLWLWVPGSKTRRALAGT